MLRSLSAKTLLTALGVVALSFAATASQPARAADEMPTFEIHIKDHKFDPANFEVPADTRMKLVVHNDDATPDRHASSLMLSGRNGSDADHIASAPPHRKRAVEPLDQRM